MQPTVPPLDPQVSTMRAVVQEEYGAPADVLRPAVVTVPTIGPDEVLLRVRAAGVDMGAWHITTGLPYPLRLAGYGLRSPATPVRGREVAGTVEAVGADVRTPAVGDEVYGIGEGCFAEYAAVKADKVVPKPGNATFEQAAAVPISGLTALQAVRGSVSAGQRVLVVGASGGVGSFAVQIAKAFGAEVTGVCRTSKVDLVRALGADHVVDYTQEDITASGTRHDVVLDIGGNRTLRHLRRALTPRGRLVVVGGETGGRWLGGFDRSLRAPLLSPFVGQTLGGFMATEDAADLLVLTDLVESGAVTPAVDRAFPIEEAGAAVEYLYRGHARGKVVVVP